MRMVHTSSSVLLAALLGLAVCAAAPTAVAARRSTLAVTYPEGRSTEVALAGTGVRAGITGNADVSRKDGRTRVKVRLQNLPHPQSLGPFYTTYVLWAVAPEGQAENLAELPHSKDFDVEVTTAFQTFGMIVTAEPHSAVRLPSPQVVAENVARDDTKGRLQTGKLEYDEAIGELYASAAAAEKARADFQTPLLVLGARHAVDIARAAGATRYAGEELRGAEVKLAALEQTWPEKKKVPKEFEGMARDVMRVAEHARVLSVERAGQARLSAERNAADSSLALARSDADRQRVRAQQERQQAELARAEAERARAAEEQARLTAEAARQTADAARSEAQQARLQADEAQRDRAAVEQQLFQSLSAVLETRRETRGLIVSLSDVLFDFDRATLTPGAREKLSKLSGLLLAYTGPYRVDVEGHTDSVGTHEYNQRLSRDRAESVRAYLTQAGLPADRIGGATGFAETRPVASNDNPAGRQRNRRVEIVIGDLELAR